MRRTPRSSNGAFEEVGYLRQDGRQALRRDLAKYALDHCLFERGQLADSDDGTLLELGLVEVVIGDLDDLIPVRDCVSKLGCDGTDEPVVKGAWQLSQEKDGPVLRVLQIRPWEPNEGNMAGVSC